MNKETSSRVSSIAAAILRAPLRKVGDASEEHFNELLSDAKILAGSVLSQDETPGQEPSTWLDRLKLEHAGISGKLDALTFLLARGNPEIPAEQIALMEVQHSTMAVYKRVLEIRLSMIDEKENDNAR